MEQVSKISLLTFSNTFRNDQLARNRFSKNDNYRPNHPDALSTGDEQGKELFNGSIGGRTDIITRNTSLGKNFYNKDKIYGLAE